MGAQDPALCALLQPLWKGPHMSVLAGEHHPESMAPQHLLSSSLESCCETLAALPGFITVLWPLGPCGPCVVSRDGDLMHME